ncbi:hypothetical protein AN189_15030 [Loktanella sp. 3ANDIMAR09]|nr:hypothetical protein AN189_15030 [Loktanella sp. 3ANDIMAR09]
MVLAGLPQNATAQDTEAYDLGTLILSAAGVAVDPLTAPASVTVVTGEQLERAGLTDLTDALRGVPGVAVSGGDDAQDIYVRGMPADYTLLLVDGQRINTRQSRTNGNGGGVDQYFIPPASAIDRIEVVRGPMSSLYGSDAIGGVINVITKPVAPAWTGSATFETTVPENDDDSAQQQLSYYLSGPVAGETLGLQLWGRRLDRDGSTKREDGAIVGPDDRTVTDHTARLTWLPVTGHEVFLQFGVNDISRENDSGDGEVSAFDDTRRTTALGYESTIGAWDIEALLAREDAKRETSASRTGRKPEITTTTFDIKGSRDLDWYGTHALTIGAQVLEAELGDQNLGLRETENTRFDNTQWAVFAEDVWSVTDRVTLTFGARYTRDERFGGKVTPRAYATWALTDSLVLAGGVSTGYKTPGLRESAPDYFSCTGGSCSQAVIPGNPDLQPEESTSYELGLRFDNGTTTAGVVIYKTDFTNRIDSRDTGLQYAGRTDLYEWYNIGNARSEGVELNASQAIGDRFKVAASYTYTDTRHLDGSLKGEPFARTPRHQASLRADWQTGLDGVDVWAAATHFGESSSARMARGAKRVTEYDSYNTVDVGLNYAFNDTLTFRGAIYNVTDTSITDAEHGTAQNGRTAHFGITTQF